MHIIFHITWSHYPCNSSHGYSSCTHFAHLCSVKVLFSICGIKSFMNVVWAGFRKKGILER